jgi:single-strand DNA-binding protein
MSGTVNRVIIVGNVGADPEVNNTSNGARVVNLRVATSESWKDKRSGERKEKTEWHSIVIWNENAGNFVADYVGKGDKLYIEGSLQTRKWQDKDGNDRYTTEIVVPAYGGVVQSLSSKDGGESRGGGRGRSRDDDDEDRSSRRGGNGRSRSRDDDDDRPARRPARTSSRSDDDDDRGSRGRNSAKGGGERYDDLDDDIPFANSVPREFQQFDGMPMTGVAFGIKDFS